MAEVSGQAISPARLAFTEVDNSRDGRAKLLAERSIHAGTVDKVNT